LQAQRTGIRERPISSNRFGAATDNCCDDPLSPPLFMGMITIELASSMLAAFINPHGFGLANAFEAKRTVEVDGATIGHKNHLVEPSVPSKKGLHHFAANSMPMKVWMNKHAGEIYDEMPDHGGTLITQQWACGIVEGGLKMYQLTRRSVPAEVAGVRVCTARMAVSCTVI
jgi:hypothetical protein